MHQSSDWICRFGWFWWLHPKELDHFLLQVGERFIWDPGWVFWLGSATSRSMRTITCQRCTVTRSSHERWFTTLCFHLVSHPKHRHEYTRKWFTVPFLYIHVISCWLFWYELNDYHIHKHNSLQFATFLPLARPNKFRGLAERGTVDDRLTPRVVAKGQNQRSCKRLGNGWIGVDICWCWFSRVTL